MPLMPHESPPPPRGVGWALAEAGGEARRQIGLEGIAMNQEIQELAREARSWFGYRKRHDGTGYWAVQEDAPKWVKRLVWAAHAKGEILPEDFRHRFIVEALEALAEDPEEPNLEPDIYISELLKWLEAHPSYRIGIVNEAVSQFGWSGLFEALQAGQLREKEEVLALVRAFLERKIEEED